MMNVGDTCKYKVTPGYLLAKKISWFAFSKRSVTSNDVTSSTECSFRSHTGSA